MGLNKEYVEVRRLSNGTNMYFEWTIVTRFLACGLQGIEVREIENR